MTKRVPAKQKSASASTTESSSCASDANTPDPAGLDPLSIGRAADAPDDRCESQPEQDEGATGPKDEASEKAPCVQLVDPRTIRPSRWANRHPKSFLTKEFAELRTSIQEAGINVQPIKVRPIANSAAIGEDRHDFEIVFGHRRHRACLELGLSVAAIVLNMSDQELFAEMDSENRAHKALSPFEQGAMFKHALDSGLYPSARALAHALGIDISQVSKSLTIAQLPTKVLQAFTSPLDIQYRWASALSTAHRENPQALLARASVLGETSEKRAASQVFRTLTGLDKIWPERVQIAGRKGQAQIKSDKEGRLAIFIRSPLTEGQREKLESALQDILEV